MKILISILLLLFSQFLFSEENSKSELFARPLILGASISRGFGTGDGGPATLLSRMINPKAIITNKAQSGRTSLESTKTLDYLKTNPTIVLALDLFFWDAARGKVGSEFELNTRKLFKTYQDKKIPMIVGRIPVGVSFPEGIRRASQRTSAFKVNSLLSELCTLDKNCLIYDPKVCFDLMGSPIGPNGAAYFLDSLHTTSEGNHFCAKAFVKAQEYKNLSPAS